MSRTFVAPVLFALATFAVPASAQTKSDADRLFDEGRRLAEAGKFREACPRFAESHRIAPNGGTLSNLAECLEHNGQVASAWVRYVELADRAHAAHRDDAEKTARSHAASLEPKVPHVRIVVSSHAAGLSVRRDGADVAASDLDTDVPVDPGSHTLEASAPSRKPWSKPFDLAPGARLRIEIPELDSEAAATPEAAPSSPSVPEAPPPAAEAGAKQRRIGFIVGGVGVVGVVTGTIFGLVAKSKNNDALGYCRTPVYCQQQGVDLTDSAKSAATISTVTFVMGGAALAGGVLLLVTAPSSSPQKAELQVAPTIARGGAGMIIGARW